jgi:hypothetical protein
MGSENRHPVRRDRTVGHEVVAHSCSGVHFREYAAAQVVVDALTHHPAEPVEKRDVTLEERLGRHVEGEVRRLRARVERRACSDSDLGR